MLAWQRCFVVGAEELNFSPIMLGRKPDYAKRFVAAARESHAYSKS